MVYIYKVDAQFPTLEDMIEWVPIDNDVRVKDVVITEYTESTIGSITTKKATKAIIFCEPKP